MDDNVDTARRLREAFPQTGEWPLVLLEPVTFPIPVAPRPNGKPWPSREERLAEGWRPEDLATGAEAIALAANLSLDDAPYCGYFGGRRHEFVPRPAADVAKVVPLPDAAAVLGRVRDVGGHGVLKVPTATPWDVPAHLSFGQNGGGPADAGHVRFQRYLWQTVGGGVIAVGTSSLTIELPHPPTDPAVALELADRLFEYCRDLDTVLLEVFEPGLLEDEEDEPEDWSLVLAGAIVAGLPALRLWWD
jgi:hypothetical protein